MDIYRRGCRRRGTKIRPQLAWSAMCKPMGVGEPYAAYSRRSYEKFLRIPATSCTPRRDPREISGTRRKVFQRSVRKLTVRGSIRGSDVAVPLAGLVQEERSRGQKIRSCISRGHGDKQETLLEGFILHVEDQEKRFGSLFRSSRGGKKDGSDRNESQPPRRKSHFLQ